LSPTPDREADSAALLANLAAVMAQAEGHARRREAVTLELLQQWHVRMMQGLRAPDPRYVGQFRGPPNLVGIGVRIGEHLGTHSSNVARDLQSFIIVLGNMLQQLDAVVPDVRAIDLDGQQAAVEVAAWAHCQWARIHPFVNGNGRIARVLANGILMRYGQRPLLRLRPRPRDRYAQAALAAMTGQHLPLAEYLQRSLLNSS
jgi:fido (protein-threonine AMPylation protein)